MKKKYGKSIAHMANMKKGFNRKTAADHAAQDAALFLKRYAAAMVEISCPACKSNIRAPWATIHGFKYVKCTNCFLVYLNPHPTTESLKEYYNSPGWHNRCSTYLDESVIRIRQEQVALPRINFIQEFDKIQSWLDLGCGNGELVYVCNQQGIDAKGVEPNNQSVAYALKQFGLHLTHSDNIDYVNKNCLLSYDVVSLFAVIEHMANPNKLMELLSQKMRPHSLLVLMVPLAESMSSLLQRLDIKLTGRHLSPPSHLSLWGEESLKALVNCYGFEPEGLWHYGQDAFEIYYHLLDTLDDRESELLKNSLPHLQGAIDKSGLSDEMIFVARKKAT